MQLLYDAERASAMLRAAHRPVAPVARSPKGAGGLLQLQRSAGNRAVAALLAGRGAIAPTVVQRCGPVPCDCDDNQPADILAPPGSCRLQPQTALGSDATRRERLHPGAIPRAHDAQPPRAPEERPGSGPGPVVHRLTATEKEEDLKSPKFAGNGRLERAFDNSPSIRIGESGQAVRLVQEGLVDDGFPMPASTKAGELDGAFGRETFTTIKQFQTKHDLKVDGIVGRQTLRRLDEVELGGSGGTPGEPPGELPVCEPPTADEMAGRPPGADGSSAFVGGSGSPVLAAFPIPGLTCQLQGGNKNIQGCDTTDLTSVAAARTAALTELDATIALAAVRPLTTTVRQAMWRAFRTDAVTDADAVVAKLRAIRSGLPGVTIECEGLDWWFCTDTGTFGFTRPISHWLGSGNIHICSAGWRTLTAAQQAETLIHEGSHRFNGTGDGVGYFTLEGDESAETAGASRSARLDNADSYAALSIYLTRKPAAVVERLGEEYRGNRLAVVQDPPGPIPLPGTPSTPAFRVTGNPPNSAFTFRWVIADRRDRRYLVRATTGEPFQFGPHIEVTIGAPTRALLRERKITDASMLMRARIPSVGDRLITTPIVFQP